MSEREKNEIQQETTRERPGFMIYFEEALIWDKYLNAEEMSTLFRAILHYAKSREEPQEMPLHLKIFYDQMRGKIRRDQEKYDKTCERRKAAAITREAKKKVRESQNYTEENQAITRKNEEEDSTIVEVVQSRDNGAELSQRALTRNPYPVTCNRNPKPASSSYDEILKSWETIWRKAATEREAEGLLKIVNEGYELEDIHEALRIAHQNADDNPVGYMIKTLKDWKENGRPKRPRESRDIMQRYSQEERQATYSAAELNFDDE